MEIIITILFFTVLIITGVLIGLSNWFDKMMKNIANAILEKENKGK